MIGTVEFQVGGKTYSMRLSTNAQVRYQRAAGETMLAGLDEVENDPSDTERLRRLIWASMSHVDGMTEEDAGDIMDEMGVQQAFQRLTEAVTAAYPGVVEAAGGNGQRVKRATRQKKT